MNQTTTIINNNKKFCLVDEHVKKPEIMMMINGYNTPLAFSL